MNTPFRLAVVKTPGLSLKFICTSGLDAVFILLLPVAGRTASVYDGLKPTPV